MKITTLFFVLSISVGFASAQSDKNTTERYRDIPYHLTLSAEDRYGLDYELVNYNFHGDSTILEALNLWQYESYRNNFNDVEFIEPTHQVTILLYAANRVPGLMEDLPSDRVNIQEGNGNRIMVIGE